MIRLAVFFFWLVHFLPFPALVAFGRGLGVLLYAIGGERRRVAHTNLRKCFPGMPDAERKRLVRSVFQSFARAFVERTLLFWAPQQRVLARIRVEGMEHWEAVKGGPVIWLAPHFVGLDMAGARLAGMVPVASSMYSHQKSKEMDRLLLLARSRFGETRLFSRQDGIRPVVRTIREGIPFYYLPDMDFGPRDSVFVPFFGVPAATITGLSRLVKMTGARVLPVIAWQLPGGQGYIVRFYPAWTDFPGSDPESDARRLNAFIEERVLEHPEQYLWLHKRFKTRPPGEAKFY